MVEHLDSAAAWQGRAKAGYEQLRWVSSPILLGKMVDLATLAGTETVIDAATGSGAVLDAIAPHVPRGRIIGFDISQDMISRRRTPLPPNAELKVTSIYDTGFEPNIADVITARQVFHNLSDIGTAVSELGRILKPGGKLIVNEYVPVTPEVQKFEKSIFELKEAGRHFFRGEELATAIAEPFFEDYPDGEVRLDYAVYPQDSVSAWMNQSGLPVSTQNEIIRRYREASPDILYQMNATFVDEDVLVDRPFAFVVAQKPL